MDMAATGVEVLAVAIMLAVILWGTGMWVARSARHPKQSYENFRVVLGKALLLGLELMVAADIIRTVVTEATFSNMAVLGILVLIRTFLGWSISVEIEGRWPWQGKAEEQSGGEDG
jgi:uncharacterized membrane protein